ncbi:hypothetical protein IWW36_001316 [Coemansia brasiliensis]|uniref:Metallo-beta-lactamase domain-containing protein n=1 Tax=Coemansia brasiliensis TaxID=2650707 RepID=A0A9W8M243_9FUNG|nr:hypothetical protein IWW36_001316 [Coemansia brasiliensis]
MSRAFGLSLSWLRANRGSVPVYCVGAIASLTVYYLYNDYKIDSRRRLLITKRKAITDLSQNQYESLNISGRFVNPFDTWRDKTLWDFVRWLWTRTSGNGLPKDRKDIEKTLPLIRPHFPILNAFSRSQSQTQSFFSSDTSEYIDYPTPEEVDKENNITVTWIGQSTCFAQMDGLNILTDPIFKRRTVFSWLGPERLRPVPCQLDELPHPDIVLVSHNHFDHLDSDVVKQLGNSVTWFVPLGLRDWFARQGIYKVRELDWWQESEFSLPDSSKTYRIISTPTQHWSGRNGFDSNSSLWCSFLVKSPRASIFHCGDTGYCPVFKAIGDKYGPVSLAILPIGSYQPRWYMCHQHVDPYDAVKIHLDLNAAHSIGVHWGTFMMSDEHYLDPPNDLALACAKYNVSSGLFVAPQFGKTLLYPI